MECMGKKSGVIVSKNIELICCNKKITDGDLWILADFKGYSKRKLLVGKCKVCGDDVALQIMTKLDTNKTYYNLYTGIEAVKTIYREKKRKVTVIPNIKANCLYGWVYGVNTQIKNKKGVITQVRQYASDFKGNKKLVKKIINENNNDNCADAGYRLDINSGIKKSSNW